MEGSPCWSQLETGDGGRGQRTRAEFKQVLMAGVGPSRQLAMFQPLGYQPEHQSGQHKGANVQSSGSHRGTKRWGARRSGGGARTAKEDQVSSSWQKGRGRGQERLPQSEASKAAERVFTEPSSPPPPPCHSHPQMNFGHFWATALPT